MLEKRDAMSIFSFHLYLHYKFPSSAHPSFICIHPSEVFYEACKNGMNILDERIVCNIFFQFYLENFFQLLWREKCFDFIIYRGDLLLVQREICLYSVAGCYFDWSTLSRHSSTSLRSDRYWGFFLLSFSFSLSRSSPSFFCLYTSS